MSKVTSKLQFDPAERLRLFDAATARQRKRQTGRRAPLAKDRGWKREDLYGRGIPRNPFA